MSELFATVAHCPDCGTQIPMFQKENRFNCLGCGASMLLSGYQEEKDRIERTWNKIQEEIREYDEMKPQLDLLARIEKHMNHTRCILAIILMLIAWIVLREVMP